VIVTPQADKSMGVYVEGFDPRTASDEDVISIKKMVYAERMVILRGQDLTPAEYVAMGRRFGAVEKYYQPMYAHPTQPEIFVSSNVPQDGKQVGVPATGKFWHSDYQFMPRPFGLTFIYPQVIPARNRGTYYVDMAAVFAKLPADLREALAATRCEHSGRRYFKIRPSDVYRPISEILAEIEEEAPPVFHPTVFTHPATGEQVLYLSAGFSQRLFTADGVPADDALLRRALELSGQLDDTFANENIHLQTFELGDLVIWDNRALVHRALHAAVPEPTMSLRVTVHDEFPFYPGLDVYAGAEAEAVAS
jgi:taurine dioxygenase